VIPTTVKTDQISQQIQAKNVTAVKPVTPVTPVAVVSDPGDAQHEFKPGQIYKAIVQGQLANGNFNVQISNKFLQMQLPERIQSGDKMQLLFLTREPKLKFALQHKDNILLTKNNTTISSTGRLLDILIQDAKNSITNSVSSTSPILPDSSVNKQELPHLLQKAIFQSGLFYESHLAKWINGKNTLDKLQLEPQNKSSSSSSLSPPSTNLISSNLPVGTQNLSLVQQQLMTLETGHIVWRGEICNGQQIEWDIYEDAPKGNCNDQSVATCWKTKLTLTFPTLGKITTTISLKTQDVLIKLSADNRDTTQLLKKNQIPLKTNLQTAGLTVSSLDLYSDE